MLLQKIGQRIVQLVCLIRVATRSRSIDIVQDDFGDPLDATDLMQQLIRHCRRKHIRYVLVLGNGRNLLCIEAAHCDAVFE